MWHCLRLISYQSYQSHGYVRLHTLFVPHWSHLPTYQQNQSDPSPVLPQCWSHALWCNASELCPTNLRDRGKDQWSFVCLVPVELVIFSYCKVSTTLCISSIAAYLCLPGLSVSALAPSRLGASWFLAQFLPSLSCPPCRHLYVLRVSLRAWLNMSEISFCAPCISWVSSAGDEDDSLYHEDGECCENDDWEECQEDCLPSGCCMWDEIKDSLKYTERRGDLVCSVSALFCLYSVDHVI